MKELHCEVPAVRTVMDDERRKDRFGVRVSSVVNRKPGVVGLTGKWIQKVPTGKALSCSASPFHPWNFEEAQALLFQLRAIFEVETRMGRQSLTFCIEKASSSRSEP